MNKQLIIFDIDETLYINEEQRVPKSTFVAIDKLKQAGHVLGIATGRAYFEIPDEIKALPFNFFITSNGQVVTLQGEVIYKNPIDIDIIEEVMTFADERGVHLGFHSAARSALSGTNEEIEKELTTYFKPPCIDREIINFEPIYQMWYFSNDHEAFNEVFKNKVRLVPWLSFGADILPLNSSKATGVGALIDLCTEQLPEKIVFFGDGDNDVELMEMAHIGVAMGNAVDELKGIADFVTNHIEEDGIYDACEYLGLFGAVESALKYPIIEEVRQFKTKVVI